MRVDDLNLKELLDFRPDEGRLLLGGERMIIFRTLAFANLRRLMFDQLGHETARALLLQFGKRCGQGDFHAIGGDLIWDTPADRAMAGPVLHAWEGIVRVVPDTSMAPGTRRMSGRFINSYEADMHLAELGRATEPSCYTLLGYAHGHASLAHGTPILVIETACRAMGDEACRWEARPDEEWGDHPPAVALRRQLATTPQSFEQRLAEQIELTRRQGAELAATAAPVLEVWDGVIVMPVSGTVDAARAALMMEALLAGITHRAARCAILDLTGVGAVDRETTAHLMRMVQAARLLGSDCLVSGISPTMARTMIELGVAIDVRAFPTLKRALQYTIAAPG